MIISFMQNADLDSINIVLASAKIVKNGAETGQDCDQSGVFFDYINENFTLVFEFEMTDTNQPESPATTFSVTIEVCII